MWVYSIRSLSSTPSSTPGCRSAKMQEAWSWQDCLKDTLDVDKLSRHSRKRTKSRKMDDPFQVLSPLCLDAPIWNIVSGQCSKLKTKYHTILVTSAHIKTIGNMPHYFATQGPFEICIARCPSDRQPETCPILDPLRQRWPPLRGNAWKTIGK